MQGAIGPRMTTAGLDRFREMLSQRPDSQPGRWREVANALAQQWLGPLEPHLASRGDLPAVTRLIVLPSRHWPVYRSRHWWFAADERPRYIVSYAPFRSFLLDFARSDGRPRESTRSSRAPRLLALGDPLFTAPDDVQPSGSGSVARPERGERNPSDSTRHPPYSCPATSRVLAIARLFDRPDTLLGSDASEQRLDALARSGRLARVRFHPPGYPRHARRREQSTLGSAFWRRTNCPTRSSKFATAKSSTTGSYRPSRFCDTWDARRRTGHAQRLLEWAGPRERSRGQSRLFRCTYPGGGQERRDEPLECG